MLTLIGTFLGGAFRLAPAVLQFFDKKNERLHEQAMLDKQLAIDTLRGAQAQRLEETKGENAATMGDIQAMIEAVKAQAVVTGVKWVDAINSTVRPFLTYWWAVTLYTAAMACEFYGLVWVSNQPAWSSMTQIFGPEEKAIAASMISFWFVDRAIRKMTGK